MKRYAYIFIAILGGSLTGSLEASDAEIQGRLFHELLDQYRNLVGNYQEDLEPFNDFMQQKIDVLDNFLKVAKFMDVSYKGEKKFRELFLTQHEEPLPVEFESEMRMQINELEFEEQFIEITTFAANMWLKRLKSEVQKTKLTYESACDYLDVSNNPLDEELIVWMKYGANLLKNALVRLIHSKLWIGRDKNPQE